MTLNETTARLAQISMPGMPATTRVNTTANLATVWPGREVLYVGRVGGGPRYGSCGVVKRALYRKAIVDMGSWGTWHIPYYFLTVPQAA